MPTFLNHILSTLAPHSDPLQIVLAFALIMARLIMIVNLVPFLGSKNAPAPVKMGLSFIIAILLWPTVKVGLTGPIPTESLTFIMMMFKEIFIGFAIGFMTAEIFYAVEMAGQFIDIVRGANQIQLMVPELAERSSAFGTLYYQLMLVLFLISGLHELFFSALTDSFIGIPIDSFPPMSVGSTSFYSLFTHMLSNIFLVAITLAFPIGAVCLIINIAFGLMNRVAPQINAYFMAMPAQALGGVIISFATFAITVRQFGELGTKMIQDLIDGIQLLK